MEEIPRFLLFNRNIATFGLKFGVFKDAISQSDSSESSVYITFFNSCSSKVKFPDLERIISSSIWVLLKIE